MLARVHLYVERVQGGPKIQRKIRESRIAGVVMYIKGVLEIEKRIFKNSLEIDEVFFFRSGKNLTLLKFFFVQNQLIRNAQISDNKNKIFVKSIHNFAK